jgi:hypothetical protein
MIALSSGLVEGKQVLSRCILLPVAMGTTENDLASTEYSRILPSLMKHRLSIL